MVMTWLTLSGYSVASRNVVIPPIELPTNAAFSMPRASSSWTAALAWSISSRVTASDLPQPGMSGAMTRKCCARVSMLVLKLLQPVAPGPDPCNRTTAGDDGSPASL